MLCKKDTNYAQSLSRGELEKEFSEMETELAQTKAAHEDTKTELAQTKAAHKDTKAELAQTKAAHKDTKTELAQTKAAHEDTKAELAQTKAAHEDTKIELAQRMVDLEYVKHQFSTLQRFAFGQKREKYVPIPISNQLELFPNAILPIDEVVAKNKKKPKVGDPQKKRRVKRKGRLRWPEDLPVDVIVLDPEGDLSNLIKLGYSMRRVLSYVPGHFRVKEYRRNRYKDPANPDRGNLIAPPPDDVMGKCRADVNLLVYVAVQKYIHHMPLHRIALEFSYAGVTIPKSTLTDWIKWIGDVLFPLKKPLREEIHKSGYIQADETRIHVKDQAKSKASGKHHLGYYWVYSDPVNKLLIFDYQEGRSRAGPSAFLEGFKGVLQTDGYAAYVGFDQTEDITQHCCWSHARRYFYDAKTRYPVYSDIVLRLIGDLYKIEQKLRDKNASDAERLQTRQRKSVPILNRLKAFLETHQTEEGTLWYTAVWYTLNRWEQLKRFTENGTVEIDNNLVENRIRPIALGRKNYLFAGSHAAAKRGGLIYSLFSICILHEVNPTEWLVDVLKRIGKTPDSELHRLLPHNWKAEREATLAEAA